MVNLILVGEASPCLRPPRQARPAAAINIECPPFSYFGGMALPFLLRGALVLTAGLLAHHAVRAQCCSHHLMMHDSYGDGWNGGQVQVRVNGVTVGVHAAQGYGSSASFNACTGDQIQLLYTAGDWENENSYQLFGTNGNVLFAAGPSPGTGTVYNGLAACDVVPLPGTVPCAALPIDTANCAVANNSGAPGTGMGPGCANYNGQDVWYAMPIPPSGNVLVSTASAGGLNDTGIALWTGPDCFNLRLRACDDDGGEGYYSRIMANELPAGETLFIQAFGYGGATGAFQLCVSDLGVVQVDSTRLPIVLLRTQGQEIPYTGKVPALMEVKYNGPGSWTRLSDPSNVYNGHIGIGIRGATSSGYPQTPFSIETRNADGTNNNVPLLGMPQENDWALLSNYNDRSLVRNALATHLARAMGQYAPRMHLCEVLLDSAYRGIYVLTETIKRDNGRVDIARLDSTENTGEPRTGGYILEQNLWTPQNSFQSNFSPIDHPGLPVRFLYDYPEPDVITDAQRTYIATFIDTLETALYSTGFTDPVSGYRAHLDVPSFINYFLVNELARNNDGFKKSVFFHKDRNSNDRRLKAGPVWDFDWAWKNLWGCSLFSNTDGSGWAHRINDCPTDNYSTGWYIRLLQDPAFANELRCTYEEHRTGVLSQSSLHAWIDSVGTLVAVAQQRHFQKWPILGVSGPAPEVLPCAATYAAELDTLKHWIGLRLAWLDANLPGLCAQAAVPEQGTVAFGCAPNPTDGPVRFSGTLEAGAHWELSVHDAVGRVVQRQRLAPGLVNETLMLPGTGAYLYTLRRDGQVARSGRVVMH